MYTEDEPTLKLVNKHIRKKKRLDKVLLAISWLAIFVAIALIFTS